MSLFLRTCVHSEYYSVLRQNILRLSFWSVVDDFLRWQIDLRFSKQLSVDEKKKKSQDKKIKLGDNNFHATKMFFSLGN